MTSVALFAGMILVLGVLLVYSGVQERPVRPQGSGGSLRGWSPPPPERLAAIGVVVAGTLLVTRWPVGAAGAGLAAGVLLSARAKQRDRVSGADMAEAIASWAEMLRDATGTPRGIEGVLVATAPNAPDLIRPHVVALARRLPYESLDEALTKLVDDLDHPLGDLVVTALRLSGTTGGRQIRGVLNDLVVIAREESRMHTRVDVARARPKSQLRMVAWMIGVVVGGFVLLARGYLEPYGTPLGQIVLIVIGLIWAAGIWSMARLGREDQSERFLTTIRSQT